MWWMLLLGVLPCVLLARSGVATFSLTVPSWAAALILGATPRAHSRPPASASSLNLSTQTLDEMRKLTQRRSSGTAPPVILMILAYSGYDMTTRGRNGRARAKAGRAASPEPTIVGLATIFGQYLYPQARVAQSFPFALTLATRMPHD